MSLPVQETIYSEASLLFRLGSEKRLHLKANMYKKENEEALVLSDYLVN